MAEASAQSADGHAANRWSVTTAGLRSGAATVVPVALFLIVATIFVVPFMSGPPPVVDFQSFWVATRLAIEGRAADAYDLQAHRAAQWLLHGSAEIATVGFAYPPHFLLLILPLGLVPYEVAAWAWLGGTFLFLLLALRSMLPNFASLAIFLVFPAFYWNATYFQNGFLSAGLLAVAAHQLGRRPVVAGFAFGLLAYKPHLGLAIPLALAVAGRWRTFLAAALTLLIASALATIAFGPGIWPAFLGMSGEAVSWLDTRAGYYRIMASVFAALRLLGAGTATAYAGQAAVALVVLILLVHLIRRRPGAGAEGAAIAAAVTLCTPYLLRYDMVILTVPLAWLWAEGSRAGFLRGERLLLAACFAATSVTYIRLGSAELLLAPAASILVFAGVVRRCLSGSRSRSTQAGLLR